MNVIKFVIKLVKLDFRFMQCDLLATHMKIDYIRVHSVPYITVNLSVLNGANIKTTNTNNIKT